MDERWVAYQLPQKLERSGSTRMFLSVLLEDGGGKAMLNSRLPAPPGWLGTTQDLLSRLLLQSKATHRHFWSLNLSHVAVCVYKCNCFHRGRRHQITSWS